MWSQMCLYHKSPVISPPFCIPHLIWYVVMPMWTLTGWIIAVTSKLPCVSNVMLLVFTGLCVCGEDYSQISVWGKQDFFSSLNNRWQMLFYSNHYIGPLMLLHSHHCNWQTGTVSTQGAGHVGWSTGLSPGRPGFVFHEGDQNFGLFFFFSLLSLFC